MEEAFALRASGAPEVQVRLAYCLAAEIGIISGYAKGLRLQPVRSD
jgi:hypothetical protein